MFLLSLLGRLLYGPDWKKYASAKPPRTKRRRTRRRSY
jgi:hypothetical protein